MSESKLKSIIDTETKRVKRMKVDNNHQNNTFTDKIHNKKCEAGCSTEQMNRDKKTVVYGSIDLGTENLGVWVGRARVELGVRRSFSKKQQSGDMDTGPVRVDVVRDKEAYQPVVLVGSEIHVSTRDRTYVMDTLFWKTINIMEGLERNVHMKVKRGTAQVEREVEHITIEKKVEHAMHDDMIPAVIEEFKKHGVTHVIIETQLTNMTPFQKNQGIKNGGTSGNITMKVFSHIIQSLIIRSMKNVKISFVSGHSTTPLCEDIAWSPGSRWASVFGKDPEPRLTPRTKPQKKSFAKKTVRYILQLLYGPPCSKNSENKKDLLKYPEVYHHYFNTVKKDDLADAFLQVMGFLRMAKISTGNAPIRVDNRKRVMCETKVEIDDTNKDRIDVPLAMTLMAKLNMKHKGIQDLEPTVSQMKDALTRWKCKGFSKLGKSELIQIFEFSKKARMKLNLDVSLSDKLARKPANCRGKSKSNSNSKRKRELEIENEDTTREPVEKCE